MFNSIFGFFRSLGRPSSKSNVVKKSQTIPEAWSVEKSADNSSVVLTSTPIIRVERILDFSDNFVESITNPHSPSKTSVETPHSASSRGEGDDDDIWDVSHAICGNNNGESDDEDIDINVDKVQSPGTFAAIKADALGTNRTVCAARKPSLPPLSFSAMPSNDQALENDQKDIFLTESFKKRREEEEEEEMMTTTMVNDYHRDQFEAESDGSSIHMIKELGERPEDSPMSSIGGKSIRMEASCFDEEWKNDFSDEEEEEDDDEEAVNGSEKGNQMSKIKDTNKIKNQEIILSPTSLSQNQTKSKPKFNKQSNSSCANEKKMKPLLEPLGITRQHSSINDTFNQSSTGPRNTDDVNTTITHNQLGEDLIPTKCEKNSLSSHSFTKHLEGITLSKEKKSKKKQNQVKNGLNSSFELREDLEKKKTKRKNKNKKSKSMFSKNNLEKENIDTTDNLQNISSPVITKTDISSNLPTESVRHPCASPLTQWEVEDFPITDTLDF